MAQEVQRRALQMQDTKAGGPTDYGGSHHRAQPRNCTDQKRCQENVHASSRFVCGAMEGAVYLAASQQSMNDIARLQAADRSF
jgi:hypothetical protein